MRTLFLRWFGFPFFCVFLPFIVHQNRKSFIGKACLVFQVPPGYQFPRRMRRQPILSLLQQFPDLMLPYPIMFVIIAYRYQNIEMG